ncbi:MAG: hypothetical protein HQ518_05670 [Rhodopirellula sp.]|nr:hypothetical protein [Rhodopirellula sp.]
MKRVVVSLPDDDAHPTLQHEVLSRLPDYAEIVLLAPANRLENIQRWIDDQPYGERTSIVPYDPRHRSGARLYLLLPDEENLVPVDTEEFRIGTQHGTQWAQDLFEVATDTNNRSILLTPCAHKCYQAMHDRMDRRVISDNAYLRCLDFGSVDLQKLDLAFKGGNVLVDEHRGERIAFCGYDSVRTSRTVWEAFHGEKLSDDRIAEMFKTGLNVDRIVLVGGSDSQPELMYHLDQAMLLLPGRLAAVARVVGDSPRLEPDASRIRQVQAFLAELRVLLCDLGYSLTDIDTPVQNVLRYQHYVNAIPYVDDRTNERVMLFPVFPSDPDVPQDQALMRNIARLEATGYRVVKVPTRAYELTGGIHCLVNVLQ